MGHLPQILPQLVSMASLGRGNPFLTPAFALYKPRRSGESVIAQNGGKPSRAATYATARVILCHRRDIFQDPNKHSAINSLRTGTGRWILLPIIHYCEPGEDRTLEKNGVN